MIPYRRMSGAKTNSAIKAKPGVAAVSVAKAAVSEVGSVDGAIDLIMRLRIEAAEAGDRARADIAFRTLQVLRFAANPRCGS